VLLVQPPPPRRTSAAGARLGESRWPPALALVAFIALNIALRLWLPHEGAVRLPWLLPTVEAVLLLVLVAGDPARLAVRPRWVRPFLVAP
jgi:hypothetical protein